MAKNETFWESDAGQLVLLLIYTTIAIGGASLLFTGGTEPTTPEQEIKFFFYVGQASLFVLVLVIFKIVKIIKPKAKIEAYDFYDKDKASPIWLKVFEPISRNQLRIFSVFGLIILILFSISGYFNFFLTAMPEFQVAVISDLWYSVEPAGLAEMGLQIIILSLGYTLAKNLSRNKKDYGIFLMIMLMTWGVSVLTFIFQHTLRYGASAKALFGVGLFMGVGAFITQFTGSIIPLLLLKNGNNLFQKMQEIFSSDRYFLIIFFIIILWTIMTVIIFRMTGKKKRKK